MKTFIPIILLLFFFVSPVSAVVPINGETIHDAQVYGVEKRQLPFREFLLPWTAYEEKAVKISDASDHAILYTPFLLIANNVRDKARAGLTTDMADIENVLTDYAGYYTFTIVIHDEIKKASVVVAQGKNNIAASDVIIDEPEVVKIKDNEKPRYATRVYSYFYSKDIISRQPIFLKVEGNNKQKYSFFFNLPKLK